MQRFDARLVNDACGNKDVLMKKTFDGLFVRYEDVEAELATLRSENERLKARYEFPENQALCIGYAGGCDGDLEGTEHEENCPAKARDLVLRPHLYSGTQATQKGSE